MTRRGAPEPVRRRRSLRSPLAAARSPPPPGLPDAEDEQLRSDEEDDEALDHLRQVVRELGRENVGIEVPRRSARPQCGKEQRREEDADSGVTAEQRHGNPKEGDEEYA